MTFNHLSCGIVYQIIPNNVFTKKCEQVFLKWFDGSSTLGTAVSKSRNESTDRDWHRINGPEHFQTSTVTSWRISVWSICTICIFKYIQSIHSWTQLLYCVCYNSLLCQSSNNNNYNNNNNNNDNDNDNDDNDNDNDNDNNN